MHTRDTSFACAPLSRVRLLRALIPREAAAGWEETRRWRGGGKREGGGLFKDKDRASGPGLEDDWHVMTARDVGPAAALL